MFNADEMSRWMEAAQKEIASLEEKGTWDEVDQSEAKTKILPGTWVFRRKRTPDGEISKYKARYCVRGDLQEGDFDTFAPVVAWTTVRLFLVLTATLNWHTCSIDFSNAFVQATPSEPVWIHLMRRFKSNAPGQRCIRLKKSLYRLAIAPRMWYLHLFSALKELGFTASQYNPCLLYRANMLIVFYVDDAGIGAKDKKLIEDLVKELEQRGFELTREGSFSDFLGIKFNSREDGSIEMTQRGLIQKIVKSTNMENCNN